MLQEGGSRPAPSCFFVYSIWAIFGYTVSMRSFLLCLAILFGGLAVPAFGQTLAQLVKQQGCTSAPVVVDGTDLYKCQTQSAMSYFSGPASGNSAGLPPQKYPSG